MHSALQRTFILFLCLGLALEQSHSKTVSSKTGPCQGENCHPEHSLNPSSESSENQVENMAQASGRNAGEHAKETKEENKESQGKTDGNSKHDGVEKEAIPDGRPEKVSSENSPPPPPLEKEHRTELNQENGQQNQPDEKSAGNTEERPEAKNEEPKQELPGHRIDPEAVLHQNDGGGHVVQQGTEAPSGPGEIPRIEPNAEKELHGGVADVHSPSHHEEEGEKKTDSWKREESGPDLDAVLHGGDRHAHAHSSAPEKKEESGPDLDAVLHGGDRHAHASAPENVSPETDSHGEFGVDPERVMHSEGGAAHVHARRGPAHRGLVPSDSAHSDSAHKDPTSGDGRHDYATDIESVLHGGEKHVHAPDSGIQDDDSQDLPEVPVGATDLEALVHGGDGHVHSQPRSSSDRTDPESRPYGVQDPESVLHGSDDHEHRIQQEAVDGSRTLPSRTDPDSSPMDVDPEDVRIGTLRPEDGDDYHQWKEEKRQQEGSRSSWFSGFTYLKDGFWRDLKAAKDRYLERFWSGEGGKDDGKGARAPPHDEP